MIVQFYEVFVEEQVGRRLCITAPSKIAAEQLIRELVHEVDADNCNIAEDGITHRKVLDITAYPVTAIHVISDNEA